MADQEVKNSRPRFLSRLQRSKSNREENVNAGQSQVVDQDVADFLKPSTERAALLRPRIDVAIAQRWPEANTVDKSQENAQDVKQMRKKRRKEGLVVGFAAALPEIIGEGGDECPYATIEISRMKNRPSRPGMHPPRRSVDYASPAGAGVSNTSEQHQAPAPLRRANTAHQHMYVPARQPEQLHDRRAQLDSPISNHDRKRSLMTANEAMALKRASSIPDFDEPDDHDDHNNDNDDPPPHFGPGAVNNFSMPMRPMQHNDPPPRQAPAAAVRPSISQKPSSSPFDDPKFHERHTNGARAPRMQEQTQTQPQQYPGQAQYAGGALHQSPTDSMTSKQYVPYNGSKTSSRSSMSQPTKQATGQTAVPSSTTQQMLDPQSASSDQSNPMSRSQQPSPVDNSKDGAAYADFSSRVAHMKGVFQLTAEKERPADQCSHPAWLRAAYWWYLKGKLGLETEIRQRVQSRRPASREFLLQGHVDLAKADWILTFPLASYAPSQTSKSKVHEDYMELQRNMQSLCLSLGRNGLMPPPASLIQGQDTSIWLVETTEIKSTYLDDLPIASASAALPLADTPAQFYYSRSPGEIAVANTEGVSQSTIPCILTVVRSRSDYQTDVVLATQGGSITVRIGTDDLTTASIAWHAVSWSSSLSAISIQLPDTTTLHVKLQDNDYRMLNNMVEYSCNAIKMMESRQVETLAYEAQLASLTYTSQSSRAFPRGAIKDCRLLLLSTQSSAFRIVLVTDVSVKILSCVTHINDRRSSVMPHEAEDGSLILSFKDERRSAEAAIVFAHADDKPLFLRAISERQRSGSVSTKSSAPASRQASVRQSPSTPSSSMPLRSYDIESIATFQPARAIASHPALQWQSVVVRSQAATEDHASKTTLILRHVSGEVLDELDLSPGELLLRLSEDINDTRLEIFRSPQNSLTIAWNTDTPPVPTIDVIRAIIPLAREQPTIRTIRMQDLSGLHEIQRVVSGYTVRFDGVANSFAISRRMMVVPIHHKWTAINFRLQVISNQAGNVVKVLAFLHDFEHADAMCFQVKSTDVFEKLKGDSKSRKWAVKLVDAKFSLPKATKDEDEVTARIARHFVNLEDQEYAEEHDDITISFDSENQRDLFAQVLPAPTTVAKMLTLRRRI